MIRFSSKTHRLPHGTVPITPETIEVGMNETRTMRISQGERLHARTTKFVGCTGIAAVARLGDDAGWLVHLQRYRSPDRLEGFRVFTGIMAAWAEETALTALAVRVHSPQNRSRTPNIGPIVTPLAGSEFATIQQAALAVHPDVVVAHSTYNFTTAQEQVIRQGATTGMDIVVPEQGAPLVSAQY